jgi:hypothetical protein
MTDAPLNNSKKRKSVDSEAFAFFLKSLSADIEEAGRLYTRLHQKLVGFFSMKGLSDPVNAADETLDRAALKIQAGTSVPSVDKYCLGIARFITKERLRQKQRETSSFLKFVEDLPDPANESVERIYRILKPCFEQLAVTDQQLLLDYCHVLRGRERADHRRRLASEMNTTQLALRMRVTRLRNSLSDCVKKLSAKD